MNLLVRTSMSPESVSSAVRSAIFSVDPDQPVNSNSDGR